MVAPGLAPPARAARRSPCDRSSQASPRPRSRLAEIVLNGARLRLRAPWAAFGTKIVPKTTRPARALAWAAPGMDPSTRSTSGPAGRFPAAGVDHRARRAGHQPPRPGRARAR
jgi:hypothetical protein